MTVAKSAGTTVRWQILVFKLLNSGRQVVGNCKYRIELRNDKQFLDFVADAAYGGIPSVFAGLGENVDQYIQPIAVEVPEMFHRNHETDGPFFDEALYVIQQRCCLIFVDEIASHFHDGIGAFVDDVVFKIHGSDGLCGFIPVFAAPGCFQLVAVSVEVQGMM